MSPNTTSKKSNILKIDPDQPEKDKIAIAADIILNGDVIGYPTETVYGLGANSYNPEAVSQIFTLKQRPSFQAILIIVSDIEQITNLVAEFPDNIRFLTSKFWPGPLTVIFPAAKTINSMLLGTDKTIGIRIPANKICLELLRTCGVPITSTSANISGQKNPISADEVAKNFGDKLKLIIDGGPSSSRIPSTVISFFNKKIKIIREGAISKRILEEVNGNKIYD